MTALYPRQTLVIAKRVVVIRNSAIGYVQGSEAGNGRRRKSHRAEVLPVDALQPDRAHHFVRVPGRVPVHCFSVNDLVRRPTEPECIYHGRAEQVSIGHDQLLVVARARPLHSRKISA